MTLAFPVESAREILRGFETCSGALLSMVRCLQTFQLVVVLVVEIVYLHVKCNLILLSFTGRNAY